MGKIVGTTIKGVYSLNDVLNDISTLKMQKGITVHAKNYILEDLPKEGYHKATEYDLHRGGELLKAKGSIPIESKLDVYLNNEYIQKVWDWYLANDKLRAYLVFDIKNQMLILWHPNVKRLELLRELVTLYVGNFYLEMKDHWSTEDGMKSTNYFWSIKEKETLFTKTYGALPEWENIEKIMEEKEKLDSIFKVE